MATYLKPRRGRQTTAVSQNIILKKGEIFFEVPSTGVGKGLGKIKMGDGVTTYDKLPYFNDSSKLGSDTVGSASKPIYLKDGVPTAITNSIGNAASKGVANNLTQASAGTNVLDAYQGKVLDDKITTLNSNLNETKKSVSDGKSAVASAITAKGVSTATDATFNTMVENINAIKTLSNLADAGHTLTGLGTTYANLSAGRYLLFIVYSNLNGDCWVSHSPQPTALRVVDAPNNLFRGNTTKMYVGYLDIPTMTVSTTIGGTNDHLLAYTFYVKLV